MPLRPIGFIKFRSSMTPAQWRQGASAVLRDNCPSMVPLYLLFFLSGFPALFYQIVWQRSLFAIYGVNIESVTVVVSAFMLGLGAGSLAGGRLSARPRLPRLLPLFA